MFLCVCLAAVGGESVVCVCVCAPLQEKRGADAVLPFFFFFCSEIRAPNQASVSSQRCSPEWEAPAATR